MVGVEEQHSGACGALVGVQEQWSRCLEQNWSHKWAPELAALRGNSLLPTYDHGGDDDDDDVIGNDDDVDVEWC